MGHSLQSSLEQDLLWHDLSKEHPCKTTKKTTCDDLHKNGLSCSFKKTGKSKSCVSNSGTKKLNEQNFEKLIHIPTIYSLLKSENSVYDLLDFRDILQYAFKIAESMRKGTTYHTSEFKRDFILMIYHFYIVNAKHWNHSAKVGASLISQCEKNVPLLWFEQGEKREKRTRICKELNVLANNAVNANTSACSANLEDQFDFEQACYLDMISGECLEENVVVNQIRKTDKGMHTECYNPSTAKKLEIDPFTRESFQHLTIKRPSSVDPINTCKGNMTKIECEQFCRDQKYSDQKLARCLIPNKHWKKEITVFQKVKNLLRYAL